MGKLRNVTAIASKGTVDFPAQVKDQYQNEGKGYFSFIEIGERSKEYHHEYYSACAEEA